MSGRDARAMEVFERVADLPPERHAAMLDELCGSDPELRALVEAMLAADAGERGPFAGNAAQWGVQLQAEATAEADTTPPDRTIGAWRIVGELGRGGMGAVYEVRRADGAYDQRAALKLIRSTADSPAARERFLRERQLLAQLGHPHIATLLDGGFSAEGDPYFVMEYVDGLPIDQWCDRRGLGLRERVELFLQVLDAVSCAHRSLVVHRDLKPSNLLVDGGGQVKLLDFGIAKQLQGGDATATSDRALTFEYASPEQLHDAPITTATDIWQLGIVLHRLLSGSHPFGLTRDTPLPKQLQLLESEPEPLTRAAAQAAPEQAALRGGLSPEALARDLRGPLSQVVQGCLRRTPEGRYASVEALDEDLRRWLDHRPLRIVPPSRAAGLRLWLRRNRGIAVAAALAVAALLAGTGASLWQAHEARHQASIAEQRRVEAEKQNANARAAMQFLTDTLAAAAPEQALSTEVSVRQLLDKAREQLSRGDAERSPEVEKTVQRLLGHLYASLGEQELAMQSYDAGLKDVQPASREEAAALADDLLAYALQLGVLEQREEALRVSQQGAELRRRYAADDPNQEFLALYQLGIGYNAALERDEAEEYWKQALELLPQLPQPPVGEAIEVFRVLSFAARDKRDYATSTGYTDRALALADAHDLPAQSPARARLMLDKASDLLGGGDTAAAEQVLREGIALQSQVVGQKGMDTAGFYNLLASILDLQGRYQESIDAARHLNELVDASQGGRPTQDKSVALFRLASAHMAAGDYANAERIFAQSIAVLDSLGVAPDAQIRVSYEPVHARSLSFLGRYPEARALLESVRARIAASEGEDAFWYAMSTLQLAVVAQHSGDPRRGRPLLEETRTRMARHAPPEGPLFGHLFRIEANFAKVEGKLDEAEQHQRQALRQLEATAANPTQIAGARAELAEIRLLQGDRDEARELLRQALPVLRERVLPQEIKRALAEKLAGELGIPGTA